jgi:predicted dehydrogenase
VITVGVIGYGYWGPNLVRNFSELPEARLVAVVDLEPNRLAAVRRRYPSVRTTESYRDVVRDPEIDAVVVASPASTHFEVALDSLRAGKHVLVEKPMTATSEEAARLIDEAARRDLVLMVDHTFVYTSAVRKIRELTASDALGHVYYYDAVRINLGVVRQDVNVLWDLAVHDLAIMDHVLTQRPHTVSAVGFVHPDGVQENIAYLTLLFEDRTLGHIHVNWLAPVKVRRTLIGGSRRMIVYDDLEVTEKVKVYERGGSAEEGPLDMYQRLVGYRTGDMLAPRLDVTEALYSVAEHFVECVASGRRPLTDGEAGLRVVTILEAATQSMADQGRPVSLKAGHGA